MRRVILDCDPGHDDAFAIMLAVRHLEVLGITTIGGNCTLENVTKNALKILEVLNRSDIPVYAGHSCPMTVPLVTAPQFHGESGLDGPVLPDPITRAQDKHAVDFIVDTVMENDDISLIATGPLTNIAAAINRKPEIVNRIKELSIMGGSLTFGNWTPAAEFNIYVDPESAFRVFHSGIPIKMSGLNLTRQCCLDASHMEKIRAIGTKASDLAADLLGFYIDSTVKNAALKGANLHDACAAAWLIDETLIQSAPMHVTVELRGEFTRGMTVCDSRHLCGTASAIDYYREPQMPRRGEKENTLVGLELDFPRFMQLLYDTLKYL